MKSKLNAGLIAGLFIFGTVGWSEASLTTIGHAVYTDSAGNTGSYNLIYDADSPLGPITWLDYNNNNANWTNQTNWAASLNNLGELEYHLSPGITMNWTGDWRLSARLSPEGNDGQTDTLNYWKENSEMGHLFYSELGLGLGDNTIAEVLNASEFNNLIASPSLFSGWPGYWIGKTSENDSQTLFSFRFENYNDVQLYPTIEIESAIIHGVAVRSGEISVVPIPGAIWLLGSGLIGLATLRKKRQMG